MKDFRRLFSAFSFLKEHQLHMHLGSNHIFIEFLTSTKLGTDLIFPGMNSVFEGQVIFSLLSPKAVVL